MLTRRRNDQRPRPAMQLVESARLERCAARMPLELATCRFCNAARSDQRDGPKLDAVLLHNALANRCGNPGELPRSMGAALVNELSNIDLGSERRRFAIVAGDDERRATTGANGGMPPLGRALEVLWIVLGTAHDEQILEAPGYNELSFVQETEIAGAKERALTRAKAGSEREFRLLRHRQ